MSLVGFALSEHIICSVQIIQHSQDSVTLVELEVMEVVEFWRWQEGQVVTAVRNACCYKSKGEPRCDYSHMRPHEHRASHDRQRVGEYVF